jgi:hypothetical protein
MAHPITKRGGNSNSIYIAFKEEGIKNKYEETSKKALTIP